MIPLFHDFEGARVLVFGGGTVGARKARRFAGEAEVIVVAPAFAEEDFAGARLLEGEPGSGEVPDWLDRFDPALAVAATDDAAVNAAIEETARDRGILVNRADRAGGRDPGSVVVPATARDDPVSVAIATGGNAPVLSAYLREQVETLIEGSGAMADLLSDLRDDLGEIGVPARRRREALRAVLDSADVKRALREDDPERAEQEARDVLAEFG